jgi:hypothetical protein
MTRPFSPRAGAALRAAVMFKAVIEEQSGPRCMHPLPYHIMVVEKFPGRSDGSARGTADVREAVNPVRIRDERDVMSKVVPCKVLCPRRIYK